MNLQNKVGRYINIATSSRIYGKNCGERKCKSITYQLYVISEKIHKQENKISHRSQPCAKMIKRVCNVKAVTVFSEFKAEVQAISYLHR